MAALLSEFLEFVALLAAILKLKRPRLILRMLPEELCMCIKFSVMGHSRVFHALFQLFSVSYEYVYHTCNRRKGLLPDVRRLCILSDYNDL